jgi:tetratricopeptide (TPR) repeat protein
MRDVRSAPRGVFLALLISLASPASTFSAQATSPNPQIQDHFQRAAADLKSKDLHSAVTEYDAILAIDPENAEAHSNRGAVRFVEGDCTSASEDFRIALVRDPSLSRARAMLGICEKRLGKPDAGALLEASFRELRNPSMRVRVGTELASLYYQHGDLEHAAAVAQQLVDLDPDNVDILFFAQLVYRELADNTLNKLALLAPGSARMQQVMAERLVNDGNLPAAIEHYKKALVLQRNLPGVHFELGEAILNSNSSDEKAQADASSEFQQAIRLEGDNAQIECELGHIAQLRGGTQTAYAHYSKAVALNANSANAQLGLGSVLMDMQKPAEAAQHLRLAVQLDPLDSDAHYRLALVERNLNMTAEAAKEMKLFEDIRKSEDRVKQIYNEMNRRPAATQ